MWVLNEKNPTDFNNAQFLSQQSAQRNIQPWPAWARWMECRQVTERLRVRSPVQARAISGPAAYAYRRQPTDASLLCRCFSLSLPLSPPLSLPKSNEKMSSGGGFKKKEGEEGKEKDQ